MSTTLLPSKLLLLLLFCSLRTHRHEDRVRHYEHYLKLRKLPAKVARYVCVW